MIATLIAAWLPAGASYLRTKAERFAALLPLSGGLQQAWLVLTGIGFLTWVALVVSPFASFPVWFGAALMLFLDGAGCIPWPADTGGPSVSPLMAIAGLFMAAAALLG